MGMGVRSAMEWEWDGNGKCMGMGVKSWELENLFPHTSTDE